MTWQWTAFKLHACVAHVGSAVSEALVESGPGLKPRLRQWLATLSIVLPPPSKHPRLITLVSVWFYSEALSSSSSCSSSGGRDKNYSVDVWKSCLSAIHLLLTRGHVSPTTTTTMATTMTSPYPTDRTALRTRGSVSPNPVAGCLLAFFWHRHHYRWAPIISITMIKIVFSYILAVSL